MAHELKIEKVVKRSPVEVFKALKEGRLFLNCGTESSSMKIDFKVGGQYSINFKNHGVTNHGEFIEIIPNQKIVFSWCQTFGLEQKPDTKVTIELFASGEATRLVLRHSGFSTKESCDNHNEGWNAGLTDMSAEMESGTLRMVRNFQSPIEKLFETCKSPQTFFAYMGDLSKGSVDVKVGGKYYVPTSKGHIEGKFLEIVPNNKISLSWLAGCGGPLENSKVVLNFKTKENGKSSLELIHEGLLTYEDQMSHRAGWEAVTDKMSTALSQLLKN